MVSIATGLGRTGLQEWLLQRISAVYLVCYTIYLGYYFLINNNIDYEQWQQLFANNYMKLATFFAAMSLIVHVWIGMWTVTTDYLKNTSIRLSVQLVINFALLAELIWIIKILWDVK